MSSRSASSPSKCFRVVDPDILLTTVTFSVAAYNPIEVHDPCREHPTSG